MKQIVFICIKNNKRELLLHFYPSIGASQEKMRSPNKTKKMIYASAISFESNKSHFHYGDRSHYTLSQSKPCGIWIL